MTNKYISLTPGTLNFNNFVIGYVLTFRTIPMGGNASIKRPVCGKKKGSRGPNL